MSVITLDIRRALLAVRDALRRSLPVEVPPVALSRTPTALLATWSVVLPQNTPGIEYEFSTLYGQPSRLGSTTRFLTLNYGNSMSPAGAVSFNGVLNANGQYVTDIQLSWHRDLMRYGVLTPITVETSCTSPTS